MFLIWQAQLYRNTDYGLGNYFPSCLGAFYDNYYVDYYLLFVECITIISYNPVFVKWKKDKK